MLNKKVIIRVDGDRLIGLGHLYRGIALAEILKNHFNIEFLLREGSMIDPILNLKYSYQIIPKKIIYKDEPEWIANNISKNAIITLDGYQFTKNYQRKLKNQSYKLVFIDDLAKGSQCADVVINHSPGASKEDYAISSYTYLALGLDFALLRKSFSQIDRKKLKTKRSIKNLLISFGGADPSDFTYKTVKEILDIEFIEKISVIVGAAYIHRSIYDIKSPKLRIYEDLSEKDVIDVMLDTDLAVVPASTISIELAKLGIPMILGYYVDNQLNIFNGFVDKKVVNPIGNFNKYDFSSLQILLRDMNDVRKLSSYSNRLLTLFKTYSTKNIIDLFMLEEPFLREAELTDMEFTFKLSNDPVVRSNSYHSEEINYSDHKKWFVNQLKNNCLYYIIEMNKIPIGQIRFDLKEEGSVIGISILNSYRGKGIGLKSLNLAKENYFKNYKLPIYAYIKKINSSSIKLFEKAGFRYERVEKVNNIDSYIYKIDE